MNDFENIVLIVFRLINFGVLLFLFWYGARRYMMPTVMKNMQAVRTYLEGLLQTHNRLKGEKALVERRIELDRKEQDFLKERLMRWKASVEDYNEKTLRNKESRKKEFEKMLLEKYKAMQHRRIYHKIMNETIDHARRVLQKKAEQESVQKEIIGNAFKLMQKEIV